MSNAVTEVIARPVRTVAQGGLGLILTEFVDAWIYDMNEAQYGALVALLTVVLSFVQTLTENKVGAALLREMPEREVGIVEKDENGYTSGELIVMVLAVVGVVLIVLLLAGAL